MLKVYPEIFEKDGLVMASDALRIMLASYLENSEALPTPIEDVTRMCMYYSFLHQPK